MSHSEHIHGSTSLINMSTPAVAVSVGSLLLAVMTLYGVAGAGSTTEVVVNSVITTAYACMLLFFASA